MRGEHALRATFFDAAQQAGPVGVVTHHEALVIGQSARRVVTLHPAAGKAGGVRREAAHPGRAPGAGRREDQPAVKARAPGRIAHRRGGQHAHPRLAVGLDQRRHGAVQQHRFVAVAGKLGEDPLRLAQRVAEQHRRLTLCLGRLPPVDHRAHGPGRVIPLVERLGEGGLGDQGVAAHRRERGATGIGATLEIAGRHPDLAVLFDTDLRGPEDVPGRVKADAGRPEREGFAVGQQRHRRPRPEADAHQLAALARAPVMAHAAARVVAVGVGDDGLGHAFGGVNPEIAGRAVQTFGAQHDQRRSTHCSTSGLSQGAGRIGRYHLAPVPARASSGLGLP